MDKVRCKFSCSEVTKRANWNLGQIEGEFLYDAKFQAVSDGSEENKQFWKWTPSGSLSVTSVNCDQFAPGKSYYLDITPA